MKENGEQSKGCSLFLWKRFTNIINKPHKINRFLSAHLSR